MVRGDDYLLETGQNLAMVFYEFDKQLGIIDFPKLKEILAGAESFEVDGEMMKVLLTKS